MTKKVYLLLILILATAASHCADKAVPDIAGIWQHSAKPVLLTIDLASGSATVKSHKTNKDAEGLNVIKNIKNKPRMPHYWLGEMYNGYQNRYQPVELFLQNQVTLIVSDASGVEVLRLLRE